jgi:NTE family protein
MTCGLVLAGGGARGAYEIGVLAELLPVLADRGEQVDIVVGTSIGAVNAGFLAARAGSPVKEVVDEGVAAWSQLELDQIITSPLLPRLHRDSLLDPSPIEETLHRLVDVDRIATNVAAGAITAAAVVATANATGRSVVFHHGGPDVPRDRTRDIEYVPTTLRREHIRASAALPTLFPAVEITEPADAAGWYFDGGTRLNAPIKPARALGADRIIIVGLNAIAARDRSRGQPEGKPDLFEGASHVLQGLFNDPLAADVRELGERNAHPRGDDVVIPYIFVAPLERTGIGDVAAEVFRERYGRVRDLFRHPGLAALGRLLGGGEDAIHGELLSYLFFAPAFATRLIAMGRADARRWLEADHDDGPWRTRPLPNG